MSSQTNPFYVRRRNIGRAASPPTWACYEQIRYEDEEYSDSDSEDSCSEDDEDYTVNPVSHREQREESSDDDVTHPAAGEGAGAGVPAPNADGDLELEMEMGEHSPSRAGGPDGQQQQKDLKGKQKAVDPEPVPEPQPTRSRRHVKKRRQQTYTLRPILTIQRSQGFVWNQDLFVPPYIKDRYIASTSPPNSRFMSSSASSTNSALTDYESVEVVEIRIQEGEIHNIIP
ncbi:hypothetical protein D9611_001271 [Ephemerocybe angulata]|uniref:Uncharacterized protein n=2 Tax=Ephemerocybe angulata TaxID=980116 RepID=A0A8H6I2J2_9AGAR|nr:hypothetical protein D9611_001271 [Tulosesus angulatus]KAF6756809.1 hypothetical protein DFP72DRAFT_1168574 [Tulosesus angulatus]